MTSDLRLPRWNDVLIAIYKNQDRENYCEKINRRVKGSLTHVREIVKQLDQAGLIETERETKINRLKLTSSGEKVANSIIEIRSNLRSK